MITITDRAFERVGTLIELEKDKDVMLRVSVDSGGCSGLMSTVGKHGDKQKFRNYVKNQGSGKPSYKAFQRKQLKLFG